MKILQAFIADDNGGLTKYVIQNYEYIHRYGIQFDFLTYEKNKLSFENSITKHGGKVFYISSVLNAVKFMQDLNKIMKDNHYDIIHFNMSYANFIPILFIKIILPKYTKIILHSHSTGFDERNGVIKKIKWCVHKWGRWLAPKICDGFLSCSHDAGEWMFTKKTRESFLYKVTHNAINISSFVYDSKVRSIVRDNLNIKVNDLVIGHIGRFTYQKNHEFLIDIFDACVKKSSNCKLMLIGDGPNQKRIREKVKYFGLEKNVLFLGERNDVPQLLQAMDVFCLPSHFEGLGIVGVEAQAAGLPCIVSDRVPKELAITEACQFLPLADVQAWVNAIYAIPSSRVNTKAKIKQAGYDIEEEIKNVVKYYKWLLDRGD